VKTALDVGDSVMQRLREEAARRETTALVETGLLRVLAAPAVAVQQSDALPPLPTWNSGGFRVDITDRDALYRILEDGE